MKCHSLFLYVWSHFPSANTLRRVHRQRTRYKMPATNIVHNAFASSYRFASVLNMFCSSRFIHVNDLSCITRSLSHSFRGCAQYTTTSTKYFQNILLRAPSKNNISETNTIRIKSVWFQMLCKCLYECGCVVAISVFLSVFVVVLLRLWFCCPFWLFLSCFSRNLTHYSFSFVAYISFLLSLSLFNPTTPYRRIHRRFGTFNVSPIDNIRRWSDTFVSNSTNQNQQQMNENDMTNVNFVGNYIE